MIVDPVYATQKLKKYNCCTSQQKQINVIINYLHNLIYSHTNIFVCILVIDLNDAHSQNKLGSIH